MTKKAKKVTLGVAAFLAVACGAVGVASSATNEIVSAEDVTMTVDTLGNLGWTAVTNATGYTVTYTVGDETVSFTTEGNTANVGVALTKAVKAAQADGYQDGEKASVVFNVTPLGVDGATTATYTHEFDKYIDYGYSTHDITEYNTDAAQGYGYEFGGNSNSVYYAKTTANYVDNYSTAFKNNLLTLGLTRLAPNVSKDTAYKTEIGLFGAQGNTIANYNYQISIHTGTTGVKVTAGETTATLDTSLGNFQINNSNYEEKVEANDDYQGVINLGANKGAAIFANKLYLTIGVFDCYGLNGEQVSEKFYLTGQKTTTEGLSNIGVLEMEVTDFAGLSYTMAPGNNSSGGSTGMADVLVDKSTMMINSTYIRHFLTSGVVEEKPTNLYYDNVDATMNWNAVENATSYEYAIGDGEWTATTNTYADVSTALVDYKNVGYVPFKVRAVTDGVKGAVASYAIDLERFYGARSTVKDFYEVREAYSYAGAATVVNSKEVSVGTHITYSFVCDGTTVHHLALFGKTGYHNSYDLWIYANPTAGAAAYGYVALWRNSSGINNTTGRWLDDCWRGLKTSFETEKTYFVTYGVDDVFENEVKVAERIFFRLYDENNQTILVTTFDNAQCFAEDDATTDIVENAAYTILPETDSTRYTYKLYSPISSTIVWEKKAVSLTLDGKIGANAYMNISAAHRSTVENMQMKITYGEETETVDLPTMVAGLYKFTKYVPAKSIDEVITLELVIGGKESNVEYTFNVREYIDAVQADTANYSAELVELVNALETYCDYAAEYYDDDVSEEIFEGVGDDVFTAPVVEGLEENENVQNVGMSLFTEQDTTIRLYIQATAKPTVKIGEQSLDVYEVNGMDGYYYVEISNISGFELSTEYTFTIDDTLTLTCSALSYGALVVENQADNTELINVVKALYAYSEKAIAYKNAQ